MGSRTFDGVRFSAYSLDHTPPHVHGWLSGVSVVIDLLGDGEIRLSSRPRSVRPANAKRNVEERILRIAAENVDELEALWERTHGER